MTLHSTQTTALSTRHTSLRQFYLIVHAQHFPILVFNPSVYISIGLGKVYTTSSNPIEI